MYPGEMVCVGLSVALVSVVHRILRAKKKRIGGQRECVWFVYFIFLGVSSFRELQCSLLVMFFLTMGRDRRIRGWDLGGGPRCARPGPSRGLKKYSCSFLFKE